MPMYHAEPNRAEPSKIEFLIVRKAAFNRGKEIVVGKAATREAAQRVMDRMDNEYGAYAHRIVVRGGM